jgi:hypothetical protein
MSTAWSGEPRAGRRCDLSGEHTPTGEYSQRAGSAGSVSVRGSCLHHLGIEDQPGDERWNTVSHQARAALGYHETARLVLFKKDLA